MKKFFKPVALMLAAGAAMFGMVDMASAGVAADMVAGIPGELTELKKAVGDTGLLILGVIVALVAVTIILRQVRGSA